jgi:hypothetical protein
LIVTVDALAVADVLEVESPQVLEEDLISSPPSEAEGEAKEDWREIFGSVSHA